MERTLSTHLSAAPHASLDAALPMACCSPACPMLSGLQASTQAGSLTQTSFWIIPANASPAVSNAKASGDAPLPLALLLPSPSGVAGQQEAHLGTCVCPVIWGKSLHFPQLRCLTCERQLHIFHCDCLRIEGEKRELRKV